MKKKQRMTGEFNYIHIKIGAIAYCPMLDNVSMEKKGCTTECELGDSLVSQKQKAGQ
jgi:hypothetical protein